MIHPDTRLQYIDDEIGYGLFATRPIPKGTITWALDAFDRIVTPSEAAELGEVYAPILEKYSYRNRHGAYVLCWDFGRYVNHSFHSNCLSTGYDFEIAVRDIAAGEELTNDYGYLNLEQPFRARPEASEREVVYPDDLLHHYKEWDAQVAASFPNLIHVEQPLWPLLSADVQLEIHDIIKGRRAMASILRHYYRPELILS